MGTATIINKGGTDHTVILRVRQKFRQGFEAPDWLDLRVGFLLSLTQAAADDAITLLAEDIGTPDPTLLGSTDRYWIGLKDSSAIMPHQTGSVFIGFTNEHDEPRTPTIGSTNLISSDLAVGTTNTDYWRVTRAAFTGTPGQTTAIILDNLVPSAHLEDGAQQHFVQNFAGGHAAGYATLLMMRLQRDNVTTRQNIVTVTTKTGTHSGDVLFTSTPTAALLQANLEAFPGTVQQMGPVTMSAIPDAFYLYWPFHNSRLRFHALGFLQVA